MTAVELKKRFCASKIQLLYPTDVFGSWAEYAAFVEPVIQKLEDFLQTKRVNINIRDEFKQDKIAGGVSIDEYLSQVSSNKYHHVHYTDSS